MIHFVLHDAQRHRGGGRGRRGEGRHGADRLDHGRGPARSTLKALQDIPIGHKVALKDMAVGDTVIKYGIDMGKVVAPIKAGEHAHVHNIKTKRW